MKSKQNVSGKSSRTGKPTGSSVRRPHLEPFRQLPVDVLAHRLVSKEVLGDVHWSGFVAAAIVMVTDVDRFGEQATRQVTAQAGDYLIWRKDERGWKAVIKKEEFERTHEPLYDPALEPIPQYAVDKEHEILMLRAAYTALCEEKFGDLRAPEEVIRLYREGGCTDVPASS